MRKRLKTDFVNIIGAGLSGCEAAYQLAKRGINVKMYDIKPKDFTPAHANADFAELVCSNSLKSKELTNACGLLKQELRELDSLIISCADNTSVPAGNALAVDRSLFARQVTDKIKSYDNIEVICKEVTEIDPEELTIIATGPLTTEKLQKSISSLTQNGNLYFFDAAAPIVDGNTIDLNSAFICDRYGKGDGDYLNCPLNKAEYYDFANELINAQVVALNDFENSRVFEGCMPIEVMAKRGIESMRFGPLKPVGLTDNSGKMPYAAIQLRKENLEGSYYNMVGFQTNLIFSEQKRVFSMIPALKNAEFIKYGVMHRNTFINSPKVLSKTFQLKENKNIFFAGQISGVEGYVESVASGLISALNMYNLINSKEGIDFTRETVAGALSEYISTQNANFQPMNANFAILKPLSNIVKDKKLRNTAYAERSLAKIKEIIDNNHII